MNGKVDIKEDAIYEQWDTLYIDKRKKYRINNKFSKINKFIFFLTT